MEGFQSKWYGLADKLPGMQASQQTADLAANTNMGLSQGLGALGFRGNNNYGSRERLAGAAMNQMSGQGGQIGQSSYNKLAELYGQGLQQMDLPLTQGKDMSAAIKNAERSSDWLGNAFRNIF